jgi:thiol-disulfide isomerase/thioredoxin
MKALFLLILLSPSLFAGSVKEGTYRGVLTLDAENNIELPFNFDIKLKGKKISMIIKNGEERITADEIKIKGDSVFIQMPVFDTEFRCKLTEKGFEGFWYNHYRKEKNILPFKATFGETMRFSFVPGKANPYFEGKWQVTFSPTTADSSAAIGIFHHLEQTDYMTATFLTETGDYRFLEGMKVGNKIYLSCFDGSHAFLFTGQIRSGEEVIDGKFYSGAHWSENWIAKRNNDFQLRDAEEITWAKNKDEKINLSFQDLSKKMISLNDKKFENKPIIIQVMGSWCPNCMDESAYLSKVYKEFNSQGLEIIALAFEKTTDFERAKMQVSRLIKKYDMKYTVLLPLQTGKEKASESLAFVNKITAFPTTIFLNREHKIVKIHTGFNGPATGNEYLRFQQATEGLIKNMLRN